MRNPLLSARSASICALVAAVTACAGGGPGSAKPDDDPAEPQVNVQFPPPFSQTDEPTFLSYGTCQGADQIAALHIGGTQAFTADGFQTWQAKSLLSPGLNLLDVDVTLKDGTLLEDIDVLSVRLDALRMGDPIDVTTSQLRMLGPAAYYLDADRIIEQDLTTGKLVEITGPINGSGPTFENPLAIACTLDASVLFVLDRASSGDRIVSVQGQTGSRAELSGPNVGAGTPLRACTDLTFFSRGPNPWENGLLVATGNLGNGSGGTLRVDLLGNRGNEESYGGALPQAQYLHATSLGQGSDTTFCFAIQDNSLFAFPTDNPGSFTEMASGDVGTGPIWSEASGLAFMPYGVGGFVLVADRRAGEVYRVNLSFPDFTRSRLSDAFGITGFGLQDIQGLAVTRANGVPEIIAIDRGRDIVAHVDWASLEWTELLDLRVGGGDSINYPLTLAPAGEDFIVGSIFPSDLTRVGSADGQRQRIVLDDPLLGETYPFALCVDPQGETAYVFEQIGPTIAAVDLATGVRKVVSDTNRGMGAPINPISRSLLFDEGTGQLLLIDGSHVTLVDIQTGDRTLISGDDVGQGPALNSIFDGTLDPEIGALIVCGRDQVISVDLSTGARTLVSGLNLGLGRDLGQGHGLAMSADRATVYVLCDEGTQVVEVDRASGDRKLLNPGSQAGPEPQRAVRLKRLPGTETLICVDAAQGSVQALDARFGQWVTISR